MWREAEQDRISTLAGRYAASSGWEVTDWGAEDGQIRGVRYEWRRQEEAAREMGVTSGAAAVLAKRRHADGGHERRQHASKTFACAPRADKAVAQTSTTRPSD